MKKLVYTLFIMGFTASTLLAQDNDGGDKKVKLGIAITPAVNWLAPDNNKKVTSDGAVMKMGIGLVADFRLTDVIWLHTGLEYTGAGGKLAYKSNDTAFYFYKNDAIQAISSPNVSSTAQDPNYKVYRLLTRNQKVGYIHVPIGFKLKTKELSGITYYGQIGADMFFRTSARGDDKVTQYVNQYGGTNGTKNETTLTKNDINGSINFLNAAASVGFGIEYRISGSTALTASVQYRHGIMNFTSADNDYLLRSNVTSATGASYSQFANATKLRQVVLTVGIMF